MTEIRRYAAFTREPSAGNPAGVVLDAAALDPAAMQAIAADVGYSETAFAEQTGPGHYRLRFFSPLAEVDFCGHATIATAVVLAEREGVGELRFDTTAGPITITATQEHDLVRASLRSVPTSSQPMSEDDLDATLAPLGWSASDLDSRYPPHVAFAGNYHPVIAADTRDRLARLDYDFDALADVMRSRGWTTLQLFWQQDEDVFHARNPFPIGGVVEDPATGSAAAALGGYLRAIGQVSGTRHFVIVQGEDMGRRSELDVEVSADDPTVVVSGTAVRIPD